jgi:hypothetical protein
LVLPIAFLSLIIVFWAYKTQRASAKVLITALGLPLIIGAVGYAAYNYARFDSVTEFGLRYQLTVFNLYESLAKTFSLAYIPANLYKTLLSPFEVHKKFPFIFAIPAAAPDLLEGAYPDIYLLYREDITGMIVASPFILFAFLARQNINIRWVFMSLAGSCILIFFTMQGFFFATMRYLLDLTPALSLLAVIGFWQSLVYLKNRPVARSVLSVVAISLFIYSLIMSLLLPISADIKAISTFNPELLINLRQLFK